MMHWRTFAAALLLAAAGAGGAVHLDAQPPAQAAPRRDLVFAAPREPSRSPAWSTSRSAATTRPPPIQQTDPEGVPLFSAYVEELRAGRRGDDHAREPRPSGGEPGATSRPASTGCSRSSTSTRASRAPTATRCGCTWTSGKARTGSARRATSTATRSRCGSTRRRPTPITLVADKVIPPIRSPADTDMVKRIKIQSQILTKWWGQPIFLGATILLPKDYDEASRRPLPGQLHPGALLAAARRAASGAAATFDKLWLADDTPRFIYVTLQHPSPYYDDSYARELGEQRAVRRRDHAGAAARGRDAVPRHPPAVGAHALRRIDRRLDRRGAPGVLSGLLRRLVRQLPRFGRLQLSPDRQHLQGRQRLLHRPRLDEGRPPDAAPPRRQHRVDDEGREPLRARPSATSRARADSGTSGRRPTLPSARTATRCASGTRRPAPSITPSRRSGRRYDLLDVLEDQLGDARPEGRRTS